MVSPLSNNNPSAAQFNAVKEHSSHFRQSSVDFIYKCATAPYNLLRDQIQKKCWNLELFQASHFVDFNQERINGSRDALKAIGGERTSIKTSDGAATLDGFYFDVSEFKRKIVDLGGQFDFVTDEKGKRKQVIKVFNNELDLFLAKMGIEAELNKGYDPEAADNGTSKWLVTIPIADTIDQTKLPPIEIKPGVTILTNGSTDYYEKHRERIAETLLSGQSCFVFNLRGVLGSTGISTENTTYSDIEDVFNYLKEVKKYPNDHITVKGHCIGGAIGTYLASVKPKVNLTLDRSFSRATDVFVRLQWPDLGKLLDLDEVISKVLSKVGFVSFDSASRMKSVTGHVCVVRSQDDNFIPPAAASRLLNKVKDNSGFLIELSSGIDHDTAWDAEALKNYSKFLHSHGTLRSFGKTIKA